MLARAPGQTVTVRAEGAESAREQVEAAVASRLAEAGVKPAPKAARTLTLRIEQSVGEEIRTAYYGHDLRVAALLDGSRVGTVTESRGFGRTPAEAAAEAASKAAEQLVGELLARSVTGFERKVRITVDHITDAAAYRRLTARLGGLRWVVSLKPDGVGLRGGRAVWIARASQPGRVLAARLDQEPDLAVVSFDSGHVNLRFVKPE